MSACGSADTCRSTMTGRKPPNGGASSFASADRKRLLPWRCNCLSRCYLDHCSTTTHSVNSMPKDRRIIITETRFRSTESPRRSPTSGGRARQSRRGRFSPRSSRRGHHELTGAVRGRKHWRAPQGHDRFPPAGGPIESVRFSARAGGHCPSRTGGGTIHRVAVSRWSDTLPPRSENHLPAGGRRGTKPSHDGKTAPAPKAG